MNYFLKCLKHYKNGKIDTLEGKERLDVKDYINDIVKEHDFQKIEFDIANGKRVSFLRTIRHKVKYKKG